MVTSPALIAAHEARAARKALGIEIVHRNPIEKARDNPTSLRAAINGKCWDCIGGDSDPNPRRRIGGCEIERCTLHPVRPYQKRVGAEADEVDEPDENIELDPDEDTTDPATGVSIEDTYQGDY